MCKPWGGGEANKSQSDGDFMVKVLYLVGEIRVVHMQGVAGSVTLRWPPVWWLVGGTKGSAGRQKSRSNPLKKSPMQSEIASFFLLACPAPKVQKPLKIWCLISSPVVCSTG